MTPKKEQKYNKLCKKCAKHCKQRADVKIITCPDFEKVWEQMTIKGLFSSSSSKKAKK
ncbi:MAG TPA: hypothetical protein PLR70_02325 [Candidatus Syntrophosphaera thermopropionivorans]|jgi:hypothetical protein|nr:hypothetical protein [Candidatus Syntrophosphaera thermopropionivorans]